MAAHQGLVDTHTIRKQAVSYRSHEFSIAPVSLTPSRVATEASEGRKISKLAYNRLQVFWLWESA
jgi:hypothetical protein